MTTFEEFINFILREAQAHPEWAGLPIRIEWNTFNLMEEDKEPIEFRKVEYVAVTINRPVVPFRSESGGRQHHGKKRQQQRPEDRSNSESSQ